MSRPRGWQAALRRQVEERRAWEAEQPSPWWVILDSPACGIFAQGDDRHAVHRTLYYMGEPISPAPTDREGVTFYPLRDVERLVAREYDMPAVMRCVRLTGLHGCYRKAGETREYRF